MKEGETTQEEEQMTGGPMNRLRRKS